MELSDIDHYVSPDAFHDAFTNFKLMCKQHHEHIQSLQRQTLLTQFPEVHFDDLVQEADDSWAFDNFIYFTHKVTKQVYKWNYGRHIWALSEENVNWKFAPDQTVQEPPKPFNP